MTPADKRELNRIISMEWHVGDGEYDTAIMLDDGTEIIGSSECLQYVIGAPEYICELHNATLKEEPKCEN